MREATSNDPWGPSSSLMNDLAEMSFNSLTISEIMRMIWKRMHDCGKNWRHVYKSLVLVDYLVKLGSENVASQCRENIFAIEMLKVDLYRFFEFQIMSKNVNILVINRYITVKIFWRRG